MIKLYVDATKSQIECIASGDTKVVCAELACVIQRMYAGLHQNNPAAAELFKRCIVIAATDPDAPTWDKTPVEGIFLSKKVENHE